METQILNTDILIIGGGTAGCYAALKISKASPDTRIIIAEKANIKRSGCLAAGVNALNAYITKGHTAQFYDALRMEFTKIKLPKDENCAVCGENPTITELIDYEQTECPGV